MTDSLRAEPPDPRREPLHLVPDQLRHQRQRDVQDDGDAGQVQAGAHGEQGEAGTVAWKVIIEELKTRLPSRRMAVATVLQISRYIQRVSLGLAALFLFLFFCRAAIQGEIPCT